VVFLAGMAAKNKNTFSGRVTIGKSFGASAFEK
jgi:hypothetical protein